MKTRTNCVSVYPKQKDEPDTNSVNNPRQRTHTLTPTKMQRRKIYLPLTLMSGAQVISSQDDTDNQPNLPLHITPSILIITYLNQKCHVREYDDLFTIDKDA